MTLAQCGGHVVIINVVYSSEEQAGYWDLRCYIDAQRRPENQSAYSTGESNGMNVE